MGFCSVAARWLVAGAVAMALSTGVAMADAYNNTARGNPAGRVEGRGEAGGRANSGVRLNGGWAATDFYGSCQEINNYGQPLFYPTLTPQEYSYFQANHPSAVQFQACGFLSSVQETPNQCPDDCTSAPVSYIKTTEKHCYDAVGTEHELAMCGLTGTPGATYETINCPYNPWDVQAGCEGPNYVSRTYCRGSLRDTQTVPGADQCKKPAFTTAWQFHQEWDGIEARDYDMATAKTDSNTRLWWVSDDGFRVKAAFRDSANCVGAANPAHQPVLGVIQRGTATATIHTGVALNMFINFSGQAETQNGELDKAGGNTSATTYENMTLRIAGGQFGGGQVIGRAVSLGGQPNGSCGMAGVFVEFPSTPSASVSLNADTDYTLQISADTIDPLFHVGAYYQFSLNFTPQ